MDDPERIKERIATLDAPTKINSIDVEFDLDESGSPAVWVYLHVADDETREYLDELTRFARIVESSILEQNAGQRWPYVHFLSP